MATEKKLPPITFENADIRFKNFSGEERTYNKKGDRNFVVFLNEEDVEPMIADGWNVKRLKPREDSDGTPPQAFLKVAVDYGKGRPPKVVLVTSQNKTQLPEELVTIIDYADIKQVDLIITPYHWDVNGNTGIKAYLKSIFVTINEDELDLKYSNVPDSAISAAPERMAIESSSGDVYQVPASDVHFE